jgi:hypothetical protein
MMVVYDDKSGDLEGQCYPTNLKKQLTEEEIIGKLTYKDRFLVLKHYASVNQRQKKAIRSFLESLKLSANRPCGNLLDNAVEDQIINQTSCWNRMITAIRRALDFCFRLCFSTSDTEQQETQNNG